MPSTTKTLPTTKAQRKALAAKIAKAKENGATGNQLREQFGEWLTGPTRRTLLREFGHDSAIAKSYDRLAARECREAEAAKRAAASKK
jgi:hypothetical protein